jgi:hypothetical protein
MSSSTTSLPDSFVLDRQIKTEFEKVCKFEDCFAALSRHGKAATTEQTNASAYHRRMLGMYLGKRLHVKYSKTITTMLTNDGYAILNLVPWPNSSFWCDEEIRKTLLSLFHEELEPYLGCIEAIQPTFRQVNMSKIDDMLFHDSNASNVAPLISSFFQALHGKQGTLFPSHVFWSLQLLRTSSGIPVKIPSVTNERSTTEASMFQKDAPVRVPRKQSVQKKKAIVKREFGPPVPHLVCPYVSSLTCICTIILILIFIYRIMILNN